MGRGASSKQQAVSARERAQSVVESDGSWSREAYDIASDPFTAVLGVARGRGRGRDASGQPVSRLLDQPACPESGARECVALKTDPNRWSVGWCGSALTMSFEPGAAKRRVLWTRHYVSSSRLPRVLHAGNRHPRRHLSWEQVPDEVKAHINDEIARGLPLRLNRTNQQPLALF